jgi:hypothetical protein
MQNAPLPGTDYATAMAAVRRLIFDIDARK